MTRSALYRCGCGRHWVRHGSDVPALDECPGCGGEGQIVLAPIGRCLGRQVHKLRPQIKAQKLTRRERRRMRNR